MEENNAKKTRADFSTDSEWWTYKITHTQEFEENNGEKEEEEEKKPYPLIIVQCQNKECGYIIDENELEPKPDETEPYEKRLKCPKCGGRKFKYIKDKEEKEKIINDQKEKEKKDKKEKIRYIKLTLDKLKDDLEKLKDDLEEELKVGKITPERYSALMINLTFNLYKYYRHDDRFTAFYSSFREFAYETSKNVLNNYYEQEKLDETLDDILKEYEQVKEFDIIYLSKSLEYSKNAEYLSNTSDIEVDKYEVEKDLRILEFKIEQQEKYNEDIKELLEKDKERCNEIDNLRFFKDLKRVNGI